MRKIINQFDAQGARTSMATPSCCCCCSCVGTLFATSAWVALRVDDALALSEASENQQILPEGQVPVGSKRKKYFWMTLAPMPFLVAPFFLAMKIADTFRNDIIEGAITLILLLLLSVYIIMAGYLLRKKANLPLKSILVSFGMVLLFMALEFGIVFMALEFGIAWIFGIALTALATVGASLLAFVPLIYFITYKLCYRVNHDKIRAAKYTKFITGFFVGGWVILYFVHVIYSGNFSV